MASEKISYIVFFAVAFVIVGVAVYIEQPESLASAFPQAEDSEDSADSQDSGDSADSTDSEQADESAQVDSEEPEDSTSADLNETQDDSAEPENDTETNALNDTKSARPPGGDADGEEADDG